MRWTSLKSSAWRGPTGKRMTKKKTPVAPVAPAIPNLSPFNWKRDPRPSIFAQDPYFRGNYKVTPVQHALPLRYITGKI